MLDKMAVRVLRTRTFEETIQTILDDVITFHGAQYGAVQLPMDDNLVIAAQRGFAPQFLRMIRHLKKDNGFSCGRAQRDGQSIVVYDVETDPDYALCRNAVKEAGFRSVQSTPFVTEDGKLIGIVTVHFAVPGGADAECRRSLTPLQYCRGWTSICIARVRGACCKGRTNERRALFQFRWRLERQAIEAA